MQPTPRVVEARMQPTARVIEAGDVAIDAGQPLPCQRFTEPRCEPEIAFLLRTGLAGEYVTAAQVLAATAVVCPVLDFLDSREPAGAGFALGGQVTNPAGVDLRLIGMTLERNGELIATAAGAAIGHPAAAVAWLARRRAARGRGLAAGQVVLSGGLTGPVPVAPGDVIVATFDRLGTIELACR